MYRNEAIKPELYTFNVRISRDSKLINIVTLYFSWHDTFPNQTIFLLFSLHRVLYDIILPLIYKAIKQRWISEASPNMEFIFAGNRRYSLEKWEEAPDVTMCAWINISTVYQIDIKSETEREKQRRLDRGRSAKNFAAYLCFVSRVFQILTSSDNREGLKSIKHTTLRERETVLNANFPNYDSNAYRINFDIKIESARMWEFRWEDKKKRKKI